MFSGTLTWFKVPIVLTSLTESHPLWLQQVDDDRSLCLRKKTDTVGPRILSLMEQVASRCLGPIQMKT